MTTGGTTKSVTPGAVVPDGGWGWIIVFASLMIHFIMDGITYAMGDVFLKPLMQRFNSTRGAVSAIFSILPAITLASGPIATIFTNTYGCRKVTMVGACLAAVGFLASYFAPSIWVYYITIGIIGGLGFGLIYLPAIVSVGFYFERKRSFAMGIAVCGSGLGTLIFPLVMPYVIDSPLWFDFDGGLLFEAGIIIICVIFGALMIPLPQEPSELRRVERKSRSAAKKKLALASSPLATIDEQRSELLPSQPKEIPLRELGTGRESSAVVPGGTDSSLSIKPPGLQSNLVEEAQTNLSRSRERLGSKSSTGGTPVVIARKDATYQGSLHNIRLFNEDPDEYHRQMIIVSDPVSLSPGLKPKKSFFAQVAEQIDLNLLRDGAFALFAVSNFLTSLGFNVPYIFAKDLAEDAGVEEKHQNWVIMTIGVANCLGRVILGFLADRSWVNRLFLYNTTLIVAGLATMAAPFCNSHVGTHMVYASLFGFFSGGYVGLTSIIVVDLVGVDKLSDAFGVLLLFQGVAVAVGPPIAGTMRDKCSGFRLPYLWPYMIFGGSIVISGLILFAIPMIKRKKESQAQPTEHELDMGVRTYSKQNLSTPEEKQQI